MEKIESIIHPNKIKEEKEKIENPEEEKIEELAYILGDLKFLKNKKNAITNPENYKRRSFEAFRELTKFVTENGGEYIKDVNKIYYQHQSKQNAFILRREDPEKVMELLANKDIKIKFDPKVVAERGDKYANCAIWPYGQNAVSGIKNAFLEGRGMAGPIVTLIATKNNPQNIALNKPKENLTKVGDISREAVRIISGKITKEDLNFVIVRMQKDFFPPEHLTKIEKSNDTPQIFRGFIIKE